MAKKTLTEEEEVRLTALLARPRADLNDDEAAETLVLTFGMSPIRAAEIVAITRGKSQGDSIELPE